MEIENLNLQETVGASPEEHLEARKRFQVPEGYVLVPIEPTVQMLLEGARAMIYSAERMPGTTFADDALMAYRAMIEAAPKL